MTGPTQQPGLFTDLPEQAPAVASGIGATRTDPAASDAALTGDAYGWLTELLPTPAAPACERCEGAMVLPVTAPVLWTCPICHPQEAR
jgi:hypothetical protein